MIEIRNQYSQYNGILLTKETGNNARGAQNWLREYPSGISARYFEDRSKLFFSRNSLWLSELQMDWHFI